MVSHPSSEQTGWPAPEAGESGSEERGLHGHQPPGGASSAPSRHAGSETVRAHPSVPTGRAAAGCLAEAGRAERRLFHL